jgi:hypothetical protein
MKRKAKQSTEKKKKLKAIWLEEEENEEAEDSPKRIKNKNRAREYMELEIPLSPNELRKRKEKVLELNMEIETINRQLKKMGKDFRKQVKAKKKELDVLYSSVEAKVETKRVLAELLIDMDKGEVQCFYDGTCRKVITHKELKGMREAKINEAQGELFAQAAGHEAGKR